MAIRDASPVGAPRAPQELELEAECDQEHDPDRDDVAQRVRSEDPREHEEGEERANRPGHRRDGIQRARC
jgi:hypothetical protein